MSKTLVAYFSASGQTKKLAKTIAKAANATLFEIEPKQPYTTADLNWNDGNSRSSKEMNNPSSRPAIARRIPNIEAYDTVFVGFPIWWYVAPTIINTFLESYDLSGKTIIPFATSGGSGMGETEKILKRCCSHDTIWKAGRRITANVQQSSIETWVKELGI